MDRLESMETLLAAVDGGSLSAASRALGMPLATVSRKVSELEEHLGTRLVLRTSRRLSLTEAGRAYVAACRRILEDLREAERTAAGEYRAPQGGLTITAPIVFGRLHVQPVVLDFLKAYPGVDVRLVLADRFVNLIDDHIDLAVRIGDLPDSSLIAMRLGSVRWVTCASPDYLASRGLPLQPEDLEAHDCIRFDGFYSPQAWTFAVGQQAMAVSISARFVVNTAEAAIDAALASAGVTRVLSYQVANAVRSGALTLLLRSFEPAPLPVSFLYSGQPLLPVKLRAFLDFAGARLRTALVDAI